MGLNLFMAGDDDIRLIHLNPDGKGKNRVFQGLIPMTIFKMVHWFMGKVVKKTAPALEIIKKRFVADEFEVMGPFKCLAGIVGKTVIATIKEIPRSWRGFSNKKGFDIVRLV